MKYHREDASHFLVHERSENGETELLDCIPLHSDVDGRRVIVVFEEGNDRVFVCSADAQRVLSVDEVCAEIVDRMRDHAALLNADGNGTAH